MSTIRVLCVDDHPVVRDGIAMILEMQPDMEVVGTAATGESAVTLFRRHRPDMTLMDLQMPGMGGLEAIKAIRAEYPDARIVVLTMYEGDEDIYRSLQAGAVTYILKSTLCDDLVQVVREVHSGKRLIPPDIAARLSARENEPTLSPRETEVLKLLAAGMRNKEIGATLGISEETAHGYTKSIFLKLKVHDRTSAVGVALQRGFIHLG